MTLCNSAPRDILSLDVSRVLHSDLGGRRTAIGWLQAFIETTCLSRRRRVGGHWGRVDLGQRQPPDDSPLVIAGSRSLSIGP